MAFIVNYMNKVTSEREMHWTTAIEHTDPIYSNSLLQRNAKCYCWIVFDAEYRSGSSLTRGKHLRSNIWNLNLYILQLIGKEQMVR